MRFKAGSPRRLLALTGLILILLVSSAGRSSALLGAVLVLGVVLIVASLVWSLRLRRTRGTNDSAPHRQHDPVDRDKARTFAVIAVAAFAVGALSAHVPFIAAAVIAPVVGLLVGGLLRLTGDK